MFSEAYMPEECSLLFGVVVRAMKDSILLFSINGKYKTLPYLEFSQN